ncbi:hypothetical protein Glove_169g65 [Diversispora epigaea]|uniref:BED-type domain-containing protein n=1 Tax=Diversispora epigaea TaxID=1348612 RepID=A0A397ISG4_9GLOM|nr:hypothetical protein Glove_169g65 [Diversispora epigaea]
MSNKNSINYLIPPIDDTFQFQLSFDSETSLHREQDIITTGSKSSLINEQDIATTSSHEQEIEIESSNSHAKSKVWNYFTKPYGPPLSRKTKCHKCGNEFSYHGSPSSLKYHLKNKHKIDISNNLSQVKRQLQQIPSQQSNFSPYSELSFLTENKNSLLQSSTISLANKKSKVWNYFTKPYCSSNDKNCKTKCLKCEMELSYHGSPSSLKYHLTHRHNIIVPTTNSDHVMDQIHKNQSQPLNLQSQNLKINRNDKGNKDALIIRGIYEKYIADLNKVLEIEPNNVNALVARGKIFLRIYKCEESITDLSRAIEIKPNYIDALISRGEAYIVIGKYEESIADLSRALKIEPNNGDALISREKFIA